MERGMGGGVGGGMGGGVEGESTATTLYKCVKLFFRLVNKGRSGLSRIMFGSELSDPR